MHSNQSLISPNHFFSSGIIGHAHEVVNICMHFSYYISLLGTRLKFCYNVAVHA